jgi:hypothetical protein
MNSVQFDTKYLFVIKHCVQNNSTYDVARILRRSWPRAVSSINTNLLVPYSIYVYKQVICFKQR